MKFKSACFAILISLAPLPVQAQSFRGAVTIMDAKGFYQSVSGESTFEEYQGIYTLKVIPQFNQQGNRIESLVIQLGDFGKEVNPKASSPLDLVPQINISPPINIKGELE